MKKLIATLFVLGTLMSISAFAEDPTEKGTGEKKQCNCEANTARTDIKSKKRARAAADAVHHGAKAGSAADSPAH